MKKRSTLTIIGLALLTSLILVKPVFAASWILLARLPGLSSVEIGPGSNPLGVYIKAWYGFIIGSIGIITTLMIMWGGFKWLYSRGDSGEIGKAKEIIFSAIMGLMIAFLSYTILYIVNPDLLTIKMPNIGPINQVGTVGPSTAGGVGGGLVTQHQQPILTQ